MTQPIDAPLELSLAATTAAPARARAAVSDWLAQGPTDWRLTATTLLLVSELVTNSVRHARIGADQPIRLSGSRRAATLRLELWDGGTVGAIVPRPPRRDDDIGGFGLDLVARLSRAWGVQRDAHGSTVWLEIPIPPDAST
jgi:serine/threonine-protein kinase RsbW